MQKRWVEKDVDMQAVTELQQCLQIDEVLAKLLFKRGVTCYDDAKTFFRP